MKLRERITIDAEPDVVWPYVADPVGQALWNPKVVDVDRASEEPLRVGERFSMVYAMGGGENDSDVEIVECDRPNRICLRHHVTAGGRSRLAEERYELSRADNGTQVEQCIDLSRAGIPLPFRFLMWLIHRFGRPAGKRYLVRLKEIVEETRQ